MEKNILRDQEIPKLLREFLIYMQTIKGKSKQTVHEYYLDLRIYLRFLKKFKLNLEEDVNDIDITDIDIKFIEQITLMDTYEFLNYLANDRPKFHNSEHSEMGISSRSRARKTSSIKAFFTYLVDKAHVLTINPVATIDFPSKIKEIPKYMTLEQTTEFLNAIDGPYKERDFCMMMLFLNCGLRVSELVSINLNDISNDTIKVMGKGSKERMLYLNDVCLEAIEQYLAVRITPKEKDKNALFISKHLNRINVQTVKWIVKKYVSQAGLDNTQISAHKLRHTAATLMYSNGVDIKTLRDVLGHKNLDTTMIYTHISDADLKQASNINPLSNFKKAEKK